MLINAIENLLGIAPVGYEWLPYLVSAMIFLLAFNWILDIILFTIRKFSTIRKF